MGGIFSCVEEVPDMQRLQYDMEPIKSNPTPIVWLVGPPGSGKSTHGRAIAENLGYENIMVRSLLKDESEKDSDRSRIIHEAARISARKMPDTLVIDLIKEAMLQKAQTAKGFVLNGFPRSSKQASLFLKEVGDVSIIIYLYSETKILVKRVQDKRGGRGDPEVIKSSIQNYVKEARDTLAKYGAKMEKIQTQAPPGEVYGKIESAINVRLAAKSNPTFRDTMAVMGEL